MHIIQAEIGAPKITAKKVGDSHTLFTVAPLPNGFGMTLGNSFRRVLLSSLPGAAVTAIKIKGVTHEYSSLAGVKDSVLDMILNLKQLRVKKASKEPTKLKLSVNKSGDVTAKDIEKNADVEILNPELVITSLDKKGTLDVEITVEKGVGYLPASARQKINKEVGLIMVDATFSPVVRVRYDVTATRVGALTNLDKLEIEVLTSGSMEPEDAMKMASNIIKSYFDLFNQKDEIIEGDFIADAAKLAAVARPAAVISAGGSEGSVPVGDSSAAASSEKYTPIEILGFSPRTLNALINGGIGSIEQLTKCTPNKIANLRGFGSKALDEVQEKLAEKGHTLNEAE
jgi:DNA-directed RNA polymerase subunit alpha